MAQQTLEIQTTDGIVSKVDQGTICKFSKTIATMVNDLGHQDVTAQGGQEPYLIVVGFNKRTLDLIMTWADHHKCDVPSQAVNLDNISRATTISDWDKTYSEALTQADLAAILVATDFLDMEELSLILCQHFILSIRTKTMKDIREMFGATEENSSNRS